MRTPSEWDKAARDEGELDRLRKALQEKIKETEWHKQLSAGLDERVNMLEDQLLKAKLDLEAAQETIKGHNNFTETIRRNQEKTLMRITSFLNSALINDIEQDKVRERVGNAKLTIDQRLEALMGEMARVRQDRDREHKERLEEQRKKRVALEDALSAREELGKMYAELHTIKTICLSLFTCFFGRVNEPKEDGLIPTLHRLHDYVEKYEPSVLEDANADDDCDHEWSARRDGMRCHKCNKVTFGVFVKEES